MSHAAPISTGPFDHRLTAQPDDARTGREQRAVAAAAGGFAGLASILAASADWQGASVPLLTFVALYALARNVRFRVGRVVASPATIVLVPGALLLPPTLLPAAVALALVLGSAITAASRGVRTAPVTQLATGWGSIGATAVLASAPGGGSLGARLPVVVAALVWMVAFDALGALALETLGRGTPLRSVLRERRSLAVVDLLVLAPVGLAAALGGSGGILGLTLASFSVALIALTSAGRDGRGSPLPRA